MGRKIQGEVMYRLKHLDIGSVAVYSFLLIFILGVLFMLFFGLLNWMIIQPMQHMSNAPSRFFPGFAFHSFFLIIFPLIYAVAGTVFNVVMALIYNLVARALGGLKIDLERVDAPDESAQLPVEEISG
jgi:hypothetical protein